MLLKRLLFCGVFCALCVLNTTCSYAIYEYPIGYDPSATYELQKEMYEEAKETKRNAKNERNKNMQEGLLLGETLADAPSGVVLFDVCDSSGFGNCSSYYRGDSGRCHCIKFFKNEFEENSVVLQRNIYLSILKDYLLYYNLSPLKSKSQKVVEAYNEALSFRAELSKAKEKLEKHCEADPHCSSDPYKREYLSDNVAKAKQLGLLLTNVRNVYNEKRSNYIDSLYNFRKSIMCSAYAELDTDDNYRVRCCYYNEEEKKCEEHITVLFKNNGSPSQSSIVDGVATIMGHIVAEPPLNYAARTYKTSGGKNLAKNSCDSMSYNLDEYAMETQYIQNECRVVSNMVIGESQLKNPIYAFYDVHLGDDIDVLKMFSFYVSREHPELKLFDCPAQPMHFEDDSVLNMRIDNQYVWRCVGTKEDGSTIIFDFMLDDLSESVDFEIDASRQVAECYTSGGVFDGNRCQGLTKTECDKIKASGSDVKWNSEYNVCEMGAVETAALINTIGEVAGKSLVIIATLPSGSGVVAALGWIATAGEVVSTIKAVDDFVTQDDISKAIALISKCYGCDSNKGCDTKIKNISGCPYQYGNEACDDKYLDSYNICDVNGIEWAVKLLFNTEANNPEKQELMNNVKQLLLCDKTTGDYFKNVFEDKDINLYDIKNTFYGVAAAIGGIASLGRNFKGAGVWKALTKGNIGTIQTDKVAMAVLKAFQPSWSKVKKTKNPKAQAKAIQKMQKILEGGDLQESQATSLIDKVSSLFDDVEKSNACKERIYLE